MTGPPKSLFVYRSHHVWVSGPAEGTRGEIISNFDPGWECFKLSVPDLATRTMCLRVYTSERTFIPSDPLVPPLII